MTAAFDTFMAQYKQTGSEKADGYTRDAFEGLTDSEKETVFELLVSELPYSTEWLFFVDPVRALATVKETEQKMRGDSYEHVFLLQEYLVKYSGDLVYQDHLIEDYPVYVERLKPLVVDAVARTPANENTVGFFKKLILTETNKSAANRAAQWLLMTTEFASGAEADEQRYLDLVDQLTDPDFDVRRHSVARFDMAGNIVH